MTVAAFSASRNGIAVTLPNTVPNFSKRNNRAKVLKFLYVCGTITIDSIETLRRVVGSRYAISAALERQEANCAK